MKRTYRNFMVVLLALSVLVSTVPAALAESAPEERTLSATQQETHEAPTSIGPVSAKVSAVTYPDETGKPAEITVTTANVFLLDNSSQATVYFAISGLPKEGNWVAVDEKGGVVWCQTRSPSLKVLSYTVKTAGENAFTFTLQNSNQSEDATIKYNPVTLTTNIMPGSAFPLTREDLYQLPQIISTDEAQIGISAHVPLDTAGDNLRGELTASGSPENVYAATVDTNPIHVNNAWVRDTRYKDIFTWDPYLQAECKRIFFNGYCGKPLVVGNYDLLLYQGENLVYTLPNAAKVTDKPVIKVTPAYDRPNYVDSQVAYAQVTLTGGDIRDVEIQLYQDTVQIGTSSGPQITQAYDKEIQAQYTLDLTKPIDQSLEYEFRAVSKSGLTYEGELVCRMYPESTGRVKAMEGIFSSHAYANVVFLSAGTDAETSYKLQLQQDYDGDVLSEILTSPNSEGIFDVEFTGQDGNPIPLKANQNYVVSLFSWDDYTQGWSEYSDVTLNLGTYHIIEQGEPQAADFANAGIADGEVRATIGMDNGKDDLSKLDADKFALHVTSVTGESEFMLPATYAREVYGLSAYHTIKATIPPAMPLGYYWVELFHSGAALTNAVTGENWLKRDYAVQYSDKPDVTLISQESGGIYFSSGLNVGNFGQAAKVTLELYAFGNLTKVPSKTVTWNLGSGDMSLTDANTVGLDLTRRYSFVLYCDNRPVSADSNGLYLMTEETYNKLGSAPHQPVTVTQASHGRLEAISRAGSDLNAVAPWTEVYVKAVPDAGYRLKPNSVTVNGKQNYGRAFLVTDKPCAVTAEFEPIPVKTYSITQEDYINGGTLTVQNTAAEGDTVVIMPVPEEQYAVEQIEYRMKNGNYEYIAIPADEDGVYRLTMPRGDVVLKAEFRYLQSYTVNTAYNSSMGQVQADYSYLQEGGTVNVTVTPNLTYHLESLAITDKNDSKVPATETAEGYTFVMPASDVTITAVFAEGPGLSIGETAEGNLIVKANCKEYGFALVVALYDSQGKMTAVERATGDGYPTCNVQVDMASYPEAKTVKAFLLNGNGSLAPLLPANVYSVGS